MPEMDCAGFQRSVHAFIDEELDVPTALAAEQHRSGCAACARLAAGYRELGQQVRSAARLAAPDALHRRVALLIQARRRRRSRRLVAFATLGVAALLALAIALPFLRQSGLEDDDVQEVVALHQRSQLPGHLVDLASSDRGRIAPWFARQLPFAVPVADLSAQGYRLEGARLDFCDGQRVAVLVYRRDGHVMNLVSYPAEHPGDRPFATADRGDMHVCGWCRGGTQFFAVSDLPGPELARIPELARVSSG
jgi:anti-sigma factor RsiW